MNDSWFFDKNFNGISDDFFDDAIKLLDFPPEDVELNDGEDWKTQFQGLDPPPSNVLASLSSFFTGESSNRPLKVEKSSTATVSVTCLYGDLYLSKLFGYLCLAL
uniref:Uncharacterized protein n=1 Tax=Rhizophora mucronata TaxID=61149 RepID=A0A2P2LDN6_RHIMU